MLPLGLTKGSRRGKKGEASFASHGPRLGFGFLLCAARGGTKCQRALAPAERERPRGGGGGGWGRVAAPPSALQEVRQSSGLA